MNTRTATVRVAHPRVAIFTELLPIQREKHERMLREMGFEPVTREFPRIEPKFHNGEFVAVVVVAEHCDRPSDPVRVQLAAKKAGIRCFGVTKKEAGAGWNNFRTWAEGLGLAPNTPGDEEEKPPATEEAPAPASIAAPVHVIVPSKLEREVETWQQLATEADEKMNLAEAELKKTRAQVRDLETELKSAINVRDAARRNAGVFKADLYKAQTEASNVRKLLEETISARDAATKRLHDAQAELKTSREELQQLRESGGGAEIGELKRQLHSKDVMLTKARKERDEARETIRTAQAPIAAKLSDVADRLWKLVEDDVLDAEDAFGKLVEFAKGGSNG
jgi:hypothetical protein